MKCIIAVATGASAGIDLIVRESAPTGCMRRKAFGERRLVAGWGLNDQSHRAARGVSRMTRALNVAIAVGGGMIVVGFYFSEPPNIHWSRGVLLLGCAIFMGAGHFLGQRR